MDTRTPMTELPDDDAPMGEWVRPISATLLTRTVGHFSNSDGVTEKHFYSGLSQRLRRAWRKRYGK